MTPKEFLILQYEKAPQIQDLRLEIRHAREQAKLCKPPERKRAAVASDIVEGGYHLAQTRRTVRW